MNRQGARGLMWITVVLILLNGIAVCASAETSVNLMYYFIGGDLEADRGAASRDIKELLRTEPPEGVHVFIATGGCDSGRLDGLWQHAPNVSEIRDQELIHMGALPGESMGTPDSLSAFLGMCQAWRPAERLVLILWGHGTGNGIGYDLLYGGDELELSELAQGITDSGLAIGLIGLDACSMATDETCSVLEPLGAVVVASANAESLHGWPNHLWLQYADLPTDVLAAKIAEAVNSESAREGRLAGAMVFGQ